ncbi:MAG: pyridoxal phosphate-dependent aminotransferase [Pseudomonadota bacterium]
MPRFPDNEIISLIGAAPRHELGESVGPDLRLGELFDDGDFHALADLPLAYGTAPGDARLRAAIAARHGVDADEVLTTVGGIHALFLLAFVLCEPGDEAVIPAPLFPPARDTLAACGARVHTPALRFDDGYRLDLKAFEPVLNARTRIVSLATPQNPAGVAFPPDALRELLAVMARKCPHAWLVVDETYREAVYGDDAPAATALGLGERVIVVASLSKAHGAPGLRLGWLITRDAELRKHLTQAKFNTVISCSPVDEALALKVLQRHDAIIGARRERLAAGRRITAQWIEDNAAFVEWVPPDAGALCCVRLRRETFDDAAVQRFHAALAGEGARVSPGHWFGEEARVFRLGFGFQPAPQLQAALAAAGRALRHAAG